MIDNTMKPVLGRKDGYWVDPKGRIWSEKSNKYLKPCYNKWGYAYVDLCNNRHKSRVFIHQIVAKMFIPNPNNLPQINHKDEDKTNNHVENLEWCTASYNNSYGSLPYKTAKRCGKPVLCVETGISYVSAGEAARRTGCCSKSILHVCNGKFHTTHGYHWKFVKEVNNGI